MPRPYSFIHDAPEWVAPVLVNISNTMHIDIETQDDRWLMNGVLHAPGDASRVIRNWEYAQMKPQRRSHWEHAYDEAIQELRRTMRREANLMLRRMPAELMETAPRLRDYQRAFLDNIISETPMRRLVPNVRPPPDGGNLMVPLRFGVESGRVRETANLVADGLERASLSVADFQAFQQAISRHQADFRRIEERIINGLTPDEIDTMIYATLGAKAMAHVFPRDMPLSSWAPDAFEFGCFKAHKIKTIEQAEAEGVKMKHCMGNLYLQKMAKGMHVAYHVDSPYNKRGLTIGFNAYRMKWVTTNGNRRLVPIRPGEAGSWKLYQCVGATNSTPKGPLQEVKLFEKNMEKFINEAWERYSSGGQHSVTVKFDELFAEEPSPDRMVRMMVHDEVLVARPNHRVRVSEC